MSTALCTTVAHNTTQNRPNNFPCYPPDSHHCSDNIYLRVKAVPKKNPAQPAHPNHQINATKLQTELNCNVNMPVYWATAVHGVGTDMGGLVNVHGVTTSLGGLASVHGISSNLCGLGSVHGVSTDLGGLATASLSTNQHNLVLLNGI